MRRQNVDAELELVHGPPASQQQSTARTRLVTLGALVCVLIGLIVAVGWHTANNEMVRLYGDGRPMSYPTAMGVIAAGLTILFLAWNRRTPAIVFGVLTTAIAIAATAGVLFGVELSPLRPLMRFDSSAPGYPPPRLELESVICTLLIGLVSVIATVWPRGRLSELALSVGGMMVAAAGFVLLVVNLAGTSGMYGYGRFAPMAAHTALAFTVLGVSAIATIRPAAEDRDLGYRGWYPIAVGAGIMVVAISLWQVMSFERRDRVTELGSLEAEHQSDHLLSEVSTRLLRFAAATTTAPYTRFSDGTVWTEWADDLLAGRPGFARIDWLDSNCRLIQSSTQANLAGQLAAAKAPSHTCEDLRSFSSYSGYALLRSDVIEGRADLQAVFPVPAIEDPAGSLVLTLNLEGLLDSILDGQARPVVFSLAIYEGEQLIFERDLDPASSVRNRVQWHRRINARFDNAEVTVEVWPTDRWLSANGTPMPEMTLAFGILVALTLGATVYVIQKMQLRTKQIQGLAEQRRVAEEERERLFNLSIDLFCIANPKGYVLELNPAWEQTFGYTIREIKEQPFVDMVHPDDRPAVLLRFEQPKALMFQGIPSRVGCAAKMAPTAGSCGPAGIRPSPACSTSSARTSPNGAARRSCWVSRRARSPARTRRWRWRWRRHRRPPI